MRLRSIRGALDLRRVRDYILGRPGGWTMKPRALAVCFASIGLLLAACSPLWAHHSFGVEYDVNKPVTMTGVITSIEWTNPHSFIYIDITDANGKVTNWKDVGGPDIPIVLILRPASSGTRATFKAIVLGGKDEATTGQTLTEDSNGAVTQAVTTTPAPSSSNHRKRLTAPPEVGPPATPRSL